jgi:hypothetical protein
MATKSSPKKQNSLLSHFNNNNLHYDGNHKVQKHVKFWFYKTVYLDLLLLVSGILLLLISNTEAGKLVNNQGVFADAASLNTLYSYAIVLVTLGITSLILSILVALGL